MTTPGIPSAAAYVVASASAIAVAASRNPNGASFGVSRAKLLRAPDPCTPVSGCDVSPVIMMPSSSTLSSADSRTELLKFLFRGGQRGHLLLDGGGVELLDA